jgi:hypothetical protein
VVGAAHLAVDDSAPPRQTALTCAPEAVVAIDGTEATGVDQTPEGAAPALVVDPPTVAATRAALAALGDGPSTAAVTGWADLTSPHLADLLDDLQHGPGGHRLAAIAHLAPAAPEAWLADVAVRRGLACLQRAGLALHLVGPAAQVAERLRTLEPALEVWIDPR